MSADIRWVQRLKNFNKALLQLEKAVDLRVLSDLEKEGLLQRFEYTYELGWKTLKDFLEYQGFADIIGARDTFRKAFQSGLIQDGEAWMKMIADRNLVAHTYKEEVAEQIIMEVKNSYFGLLHALAHKLNHEANEK